MSQQTKQPAQQKKKFPNALVIVFCIMILAVILTWVVPAGQYSTLPDSSTLDPNSYHQVEQSPVGLWGLLDAVFQGMSNASSIIVLFIMSWILKYSAKVSKFLPCSKQLFWKNGKLPSSFLCPHDSLKHPESFQEVFRGFPGGN